MSRIFILRPDEDTRGFGPRLVLLVGLVTPGAFRSRA